MRLAKFIALSGECSRRAASRLIDAGAVAVNGALADHLTFVSEKDDVVVSGKRVSLNCQREYIAYYKPIGIDCNFDVNDPASLINHIETLPSKRLFPVGRLDKDSRGLLLLTNDGECCHRLLSPSYKQPKTYIVKVSPAFWRIAQNRLALDDEFIQALSLGVEIDGQMTLPCSVAILADDVFKIVLTQGLNRQIRKMAKSQGFVVDDLKRVSFANITLDGLAQGQQRSLTEQEIESIMCLCGLGKSL